MRKHFAIALSLIFLLTACGKNQTGPTWQEKYDLGVRYLSEGNYEEAIIAFTAAIEIDPKQAEIYIKLADAYLAADRYQDALTVLEKGLETVGDNEDLNEKLADLSGPQLREGYPKSERFDFDYGGYQIRYYDEYGFHVRNEQYDSNGVLEVETVYTYDSAGRRLTRTITRANDSIAVCTYDTDERPQKEVKENLVLNSVVTCSYEYTLGSSEVKIHFTYAGEDKSSSFSLAYTMQDAMHYVEVNGWSSNAGINHITEFEKSGHNVCSVRFNDDGSIKSIEQMS